MFPKEEEYLQVDLRRLHLVALVGTQGRHAGGLGKEFSRSYRLRYSRDGRRWMDWKDRWGQEVRLEGGTWEWKPSCHAPYSICHCLSSSISMSQPGCFLSSCGVLRLTLDHSRGLFTLNLFLFLVLNLGKLTSPSPCLAAQTTN